MDSNENKEETTVGVGIGVNPNTTTTTNNAGSGDFTTVISSPRSSARVSSRAQAALDEKMAAAGGKVISPRRSTVTTRSDRTREKASSSMISSPPLGTPIPPTVREIAPSRKQQRSSVEQKMQAMERDEEVETPGAVRVSALTNNNVDETTNTTQDEPYAGANTPASSNEGTLEIEATTVDENRDLEELRQRLDDLENQGEANDTNKPPVESAPPSSNNDIPLASVEEPPETCTKQRIVIGSAIIFFTLIGVIIGQAVSGNDKSAPLVTTTPMPTPSPTMAPSESPSATPTMAPSSMPTTERRVILGDLLQEFEPLHERAFDWMANEDVWEAPLFLDDTEVVEVWKERYILTVFFYETGGNVTWAYSGEWLYNNIACRWFGNTCTNSRTTYMSMGNHGLTGTITTLLGKLTKLRGLSLGTNDMTGTIPTELGLLTAATRLSLGGNELEGTIPLELMALTQLKYVELQYNRLTGPLPTEIGTLTLLEDINLIQNGFTGAIPSEIGNLVAMEDLKFAQNKFTTIPSEIGALSLLEVMSIYENFLQGTLPTEIGLMTELSALYLNNNQLTGTIPTELGNLTQIYRIVLYENQFTGTFPTFVDPDYYLWNCDLWGNSFSSTNTSGRIECRFERP